MYLIKHHMVHSRCISTHYPGQYTSVFSPTLSSVCSGEANHGILWLGGWMDSRVRLGFFFFGIEPRHLFQFKEEQMKTNNINFHDAR